MYLFMRSIIVVRPLREASFLYGKCNSDFKTVRRLSDVVDLWHLNFATITHPMTNCEPLTMIVHDKELSLKKFV